MPYHYQECGLPNVWLVNGYAKVKTSHGEALKIHNVLGLHKAIAESVCKSPKRLSGAEFRFLRREMELSQKSLAAQIGVDEQRIGRWEKNRNKAGIDSMADLLIRQIYLEYVNGNQSIRELIDRFNEADSQNNDALKLKLQGDKWRPAA